MKTKFPLAASIAALSLTSLTALTLSGQVSPARADAPAATAAGTLVAMDAKATHDVTVTADNKIVVRDRTKPATADPIATISGPRERILAITISNDGAFVAAATDNRRVNIWNVSNGKRVRILEEPIVTKERVGAQAVSQVTSLAFNALGTELAIVDHGYGLVGRYLGSDPSQLNFANAFYTSSPLLSIVSDNRGAWIGGDESGRLHFFDWSNREIGVTPSKTVGTIATLAISPDGNSLATTGNDNEVKVWNIVGGAVGVAAHPDSLTLVDRYPAGASVSSLAFTGGQGIALAGSGLKSSAWQFSNTPAPSTTTEIAANTTPATTPDVSPTTATTPPVAVVAPPPTTSPTTAVASSALSAPPVVAPVTPKTPTKVAAVTKSVVPAKLKSGKIGTASAASLPPPLHTHLVLTQMNRLVGHSEYVNDVAFSPDGRTLASVSRDKTVRLWDVADGAQKAILGKHDGYASAVTFSPDGRFLASGGWDDKIKMFNLSTGGELKTDTRMDKHTSYVLALDFSPDGTHLASGSNDRTARIFNTSSGASRVSSTEADAVASVSFSPDGTRIAGGCLDGSVTVWDAATMQEIRTFKPTKAVPVLCVAFLDNNTVAAGGKAGSLRVWNVRKGLLANLSAGTQDIYGLAFDGPKGLLASGGSDKLIRFWSADAIRAAHPSAALAPMLTKTGHTNTVRTLAFSADGTMLASGGWDYNILLWNVAEKTGYAANGTGMSANW